tara:strand:- start:195 stop:698 length:504 start_codon:yes stop_codon:yes gene_type:complete
MDEIVNKVKGLDVITIDVKDFYTQGIREKVNITDFLEDGVLIEKIFRKKLMDFDWQIYSKKFVYVIIDKNLIIPSWAFLLLSYYLNKYSLDYVIGNIRSLEEKLYNISLNNLDLDSLKNKKVIVKGCSDIPYIDYVYSELTKRLSNVVKSLMYGEPCSRVPIFRNSK